MAICHFVLSDVLNTVIETPSRDLYSHSVYVLGVWGIIVSLIYSNDLIQASNSSESNVPMNVSAFFNADE